MDARTPQRVAAVSALVASFGATVLIGAGAVGAGGSAPVETALRPVAAADVRLAGALRDLEPGASTSAARDAARAAHAAGERALNLLRGDDDRAARQSRAAVERHQALVDAVGSTLANPSSPLRDKLPELGEEAAEAFEELGDSEAKGAGRLPAREFAEFSRKRAAG